jgi:hypothetical protein
MNELPRLAEGKELALQQRARLLPRRVSQATRLLILQAHENSLFDGLTSRLHLIGAGGIGLDLLLPGVSLGLLPASRSGRLADDPTIGQNTTEPFWTTTAPPLRVCRRDHNRRNGGCRCGAWELTSG